MKIGIDFNPDFTLPLLIVEMMHAEKNAQSVRLTYAKITKSLSFIPPPPIESPEV